MSNNDLFEARLKGVIAEFCAIQPERIKRTDRLQDDLGFDSITSMELLSVLAERYGIDVSIEEAMQVATVGQLFDLGRDRVVEQSATP